MTLKGLLSKNVYNLHDHDGHNLTQLELDLWGKGRLGRTNREVKSAEEIRARCVHLYCNSFHAACSTCHLKMASVELFDRDTENRGTSNYPHPQRMDHLFLAHVIPARGATRLTHPPRHCCGLLQGESQWKIVKYHRTRLECLKFTSWTISSLINLFLSLAMLTLGQSHRWKMEKNFLTLMFSCWW